MTNFLKTSAIAAAIISVLIPLTIFANATNENQKEIVEQYLYARQATMLEKATPADVAKVVDFYTEDVVYEHPGFKMRIEGKTKNREGMMAFLGATKNARIVPVNWITGKDVVTVEYRVMFDAKSRTTEGAWESASRTQVTVFEFEGNKIKRVVDYW